MRAHDVYLTTKRIGTNKHKRRIHGKLHRFSVGREDAESFLELISINEGANHSDNNQFVNQKRQNYVGEKNVNMSLRNVKIIRLRLFANIMRY